MACRLQLGGSGFLLPFCLFGCLGQPDRGKPAAASYVAGSAALGVAVEIIAQGAGVIMSRRFAGFSHGREHLVVSCAVVTDMKRQPWPAYAHVRTADSLGS